MSAEDPIARLIPWYATGNLDSAESAKVETHLAACEECRDLLSVARALRRLAPRVSREVLFDHVQSQRLVEFAADPATLEPDARRIITTHIKSCEVCAEALEILESLGRDPIGAGLEDAPGAADSVPPGGALRAWKDLWRRLSRTVLHPAPALAYLAALVVLLVVLPLRAPGPGREAPPGPETGGGPSGATGSQPPAPGPAPMAPVTVMPPPFELRGEVEFRGSHDPPPPASVPRPAGSAVVVLGLVADIDPEDLQDPDLTFRVEIMAGDRLLLEERRHAADFDRRGRLLLLLAPEAVAPGVPGTVRVVLERPGNSRDGEEIYRRSFILVEDSPPR